MNWINRNMTTAQIDVQELMETFLEGLRTLVPIFERAQLGWKEEDAYDPWDQTSETLYKAIVGSTIEFGVFDEPVLELPTYGIMPHTCMHNSYITEVGAGGAAVFVGFITDKIPFDVCLFANIDRESKTIGQYRKMTSDVKFTFVPRSKRGCLMSEMHTLAYIP
jgi:hypothetical protein